LTLDNSDGCEAFSAGRRAARSAFSSALMRSHAPFTSAGVNPANHFAGDGLDHIAERKCILLFRHAGVKHHLQQQIAEFVAEIAEIAPGDGIGDFIGLLDGVGRDGRKILFEIPGTAGDRRSQLRHDFEQTGNITGRGHGTPKLYKQQDRALYAARCVPVPAKSGHFSRHSHPRTCIGGAALEC
jgi:hypothetical protein